jgi:MFS transporter, MHS family, proline/betaine transporter
VRLGGGVPTVRVSVFFSSIGEVVEWFDFMVYLSLAPVLAKVIFAPDQASSLVMTLGIFGAAFLARPIGAVLFSHLGDRFGRKRALVTSALHMALAKLVEGLLPTYTTAGHLAPAVFLLAVLPPVFLSVGNLPAPRLCFSNRLMRDGAG